MFVLFGANSVWLEVGSWSHCYRSIIVVYMTAVDIAKILVKHQ